MSVNKVFLLGNLGAAPELKHTPGGTAVCNFRMATSKKIKGDQRTEWHNVVTWGKTAELCNNYLNKGSQVYIEGELQTRTWEDKNGQKRYTTEVNGAYVKFLDKLEEQEVNGNVKEDLITTDDIPF